MPSGIYERKKRSLQERFWEKVKKTNNCWLWVGAKSRGYGGIMDSIKMRSTHRVSWELHNGKIPKGMFVLHRCDKPSCVNPNHLFLGTQTDNMQDMASKGRKVNNQSRGEDHYLSKLNNKKAIKIRKMYKTGKYYQYELGKIFGVAQSQIGSVVNNKTWIHT